MKYLLTVSYMGGRYCGWQVQKNAVSVQQTLQQAASALFGRDDLLLTGSSRTDSGVHARAFRCTLELPDFSGRGCCGSGDAPLPIPPRALPLALNTRLPDDIAVTAAEAVDDAFHPRYDAKGKEYEYLIYSSDIRSPFYEGRAYHFHGALDAEAMGRAARHFEGEHDFAAFCAAGSDVADTVRTVFTCRVSAESISEDARLVSVRVYGNGFLYNMVRIIAGTLLDVGRGKISADAIPSVIAGKRRSDAGATLPAHGLYLDRVVYNEKEQ